MLGIIIINYNTYEKTIDCIRSIEETYDNDYIIYLLDNASPNESKDVLQEQFGNDKRVKLISESENLGYANGNNLCLKMAKEDGCEYAIISNNDIIYKPKAIERLLKDIIETGALLVGPNVVKPSGEVQTTVKLKRPDFVEYLIFETYIRNLFKRSYAKYKMMPTSSCEVYWVAGCTFIIDINKFESIGLFDPYTFLYFEEYILSEKALQSDLKLRYCKDANVIHYHGFSMGGALNVVTRSANWRSEAYFLKKYWKWNYLKRCILWHIRVLEIRFNARKEPNKNELVDEFKNGRKYL